MEVEAWEIYQEISHDHPHSSQTQSTFYKQLLYDDHDDDDDEMITCSEYLTTTPAINIYAVYL